MAALVAPVVDTPQVDMPGDLEVYVIVFGTLGPALAYLLWSVWRGGD